MKMYTATISSLIFFIIFWISLVMGNEYDHDPTTQELANVLLGYDLDGNEADNDISSDVDKRSDRYAFGLGRRAYHYTSGLSGVKRLPIYNFGLGKRARPYSFGLGKRTYNKDDDTNMLLEATGEQIYGQPSSFPRNQRNRPYSFGLGKRSSPDNLMYAMERRIPQGNLYNFGLGKRSPSTSDNELNEHDHKVQKRETKGTQIRNFDFGLGKR
ncbi:allatostatin-A [Condylostylus longicornis]|uniref:allatostatin-A n=1 Tax=Condylostylus longicornis TaxID=2530218 RepID=UPI00244DD577|nr:allatostatin-A [Condylostylus longicornis]